MSQRVPHVVCGCHAQRRGAAEWVRTGNSGKNFRVTPRQKPVVCIINTSQALSTLFLLCLIPKLLQSQTCFLVEGTPSQQHKPLSFKKKISGHLEEERGSPEFFHYEELPMCLCFFLTLFSLAFFTVWSTLTGGFTEGCGVEGETRTVACCARSCHGIPSAFKAVIFGIRYADDDNKAQSIK